MQRPDRESFIDRTPAQLTVAQILSRARTEIAAVTDLPVLAVTRSARNENGGWTVELEVLESAARMGDNDLLAAFELQFDPFGEVTGIARVGRYRREAGSLR